MTAESPVAVRCHAASGWFDGDGVVVERENPSRPAEVVARWSAATPAQVGQAIEAAAEAHAGWRSTPIGGRCAVLRAAGRLLEARADAYARELSREEGKIVGEARGEVLRAAAILEYYAGEASRPRGEVFAGGRVEQSLFVVDQPVGIVAVVTPWNFPIAIPAWKIAPALAFGNSVVWKPAPASSLLAMRLLECLLEAGLPAGAVTLLLGDAEVGEAILAAPAIDAVSFTGSTGVGRSIVRAAAERGLAVQAELGGKNALIVGDDADLDAAVLALVSGAFSGNGEKCTATSRVLVDARVADDFLALARLAIEALRHGDATDADTDVGPLVSASARDRVRDALGRSDGVVVAAAALPDGEGWFVAPTLVELAQPTGELWDEELFGPVVAMHRVASFDEALAVANASPYGLAAAVYTRDLARTRQAIEQLDVGMLSINEPTTGGYPYVPFGGWKGSAVGPREQGAAARQFYTRSKTVHLSA
ncbi:aldehyde dehydrogenase family protein [Pseudolysinimonas sp.]|jgi:acyl-CoA reductase-like NAD-dependent aldehyde dehydrogenase|uniref:aldehyde dehydrogenase family protein n=1 Tax=Pseudolysinimonas sp. TaxID=2680009 RepID=UPI0037850C31